VLVKISFLHVVVRSRSVEQLSHVLHVRMEIIRVGDGLKRRRQQLLGRITHDSTQRAVNSHPPAVRSYQRHADGCELERGTEPLLALAQGCFHPLASINIERDSYHPPRRSVRSTLDHAAAIE